MTTTGCQFEEFCRDDITVAHDDLDPILEMCIWSEGDNEGESHSLVPANELPLPSPDKEFMDEVIKDSKSSAGIYGLRAGRGGW